MATLKDLKLELWLRKRNSGQIKWKTKNGDEIPINEMDLNHLVNTINVLEYYDETSIAYQEAMEGYDYQKY